ncbi:hypothetical protein BJV74DRAFT_860479 [Russula compacta]|nr:hypothetical protein BJV74DRAFT_860479 [Russula compacta]
MERSRRRYSGLGGKGETAEVIAYLCPLSLCAARARARAVGMRDLSGPRGLTPLHALADTIKKKGTGVRSRQAISNITFNVIALPCFCE